MRFGWIAPLIGLFGSTGVGSVDGGLTPAALRAELERPVPACFAEGAEGTAMWQRISAFYAARADRPLWRAGRAGTVLDELRSAIERGRRHGLDPLHYHADRLEQALGPPPDSLRTSFRRQVWEAEQEVLVTHALFRLADHLKRGRLAPRDNGWMMPRGQVVDSGRLARALTGDDLGQWLEGLAPRAPFYRRLVNELAEYRKLESRGGWPEFASEGPLLKRGGRHPDVARLRLLLNATGDLESKSGATTFDRDVEAAVRSFQQRHGLTADGIVGPNFRREASVSAGVRRRQLERSLERARWMPAELGQNHLWINVAAARLTAVADGRPALAMRAVVGEPEHPTRLFSDRLEQVVLWPTWNVPRGIARRKVLPRALRDPAALSRDGFEAFTLDWHPVDPANVNWRTVDADELPFHFRQRPGTANALGRLTLEFPNRYNIYIHDTPEKHFFRENERYFSAGCVRVSRPLELTALVMGQQWSEADVKSALAPGKTRKLDVTGEWPVYLVYFTAWVDEKGRPHFRGDPYGLDLRMDRSILQKFASQ